MQEIASGNIATVERPVIDFDTLANELFVWSETAKTDHLASLEIAFKADERRAFKKVLAAKDKFASPAKAMEFLKMNLALASKHFGEIVSISITIPKSILQTLRFNGYAPTNTLVNASRDEVRRGVAGVNYGRKTKNKFRYDFDQLEDRPENLKAYMLEKVRTRRAALAESGRFKYRDNQIEALDKFEAFLEDPEFGLIGHVVQPTGAGKTVLFGILLKLIDLPSIVLVPDAGLLIQIKEELVETLKIDVDDIGVLDGTHKEFGKKFVIGTYAVHNALCRAKNINYQRQIKKTSLMICDEAHDALGKNTTERVKNFEAVDNSFVRIGFTATPKLSAKHVSDHFGKEIASTTFAEQVAKKVLVPMQLIEVRANIMASELNGTEITEKNETRVVERERIFERTLEEFLALKEQVESEGKKLITATYVNRVAHAYRYAEIAKQYGFKSEVVVSDGTASDDFRKRIKGIEKDLTSGALDMVIAVGKMAQGWDFVPLNCVILGAPMASPKKIIQRIGRGLRAIEGKDCCYVIAPNFKIRRSKSGRKLKTSGPGKLRDFHNERTENSNYRLGDNISVLDSLLDHGESKEGLDSFCKVIKENKNEQGDSEYDVARPRFLEPGFPLAYFDNYYENPERMRTDLQALAEAVAVPGIEYLRLCHFKESMMVLADGKRVLGEDYLKLSAYLLADKDIRPRKGLLQLKQRLGIFIPPITDRAYFTPERVQADLALVAFQKSLLRESYIKFFSADLYREDEKVVSASTYMIKGKQALGMSHMTQREFFHWLTKYAAGAVQLPPPPKNYVPYVQVVPLVEKPVQEAKPTLQVRPIPAIKPALEVEPVPELRPEPQAKSNEPEIVIPLDLKVDEISSDTNSDLKSLLEGLTAEQQKIGTAILIEGKSAKKASEELSMPLGKVMMISARVKMLIERSKAGDSEA